MQRPTAELIRFGIRGMWPRRAQQELLLDLGERKRWTRSDFGAAVDDFSGWLNSDLGIPSEIAATRPDRGDALGWARELGMPWDDRPTEVGVARWASALAPALGTSGKTLANSASGGLRSDRPDHRWLRVLFRIHRGDGPDEAWCFHKREPSAVAAQLARLEHVEVLDAGDALLLLSLLALWQRRRPTSAVRGNRGMERSRRDTPKPVAALVGALAEPGQVLRLASVGSGFGGNAARAVHLLAAEAGLTEAHLAPHSARSGAEPSLDGEPWLGSVERVVQHSAALAAHDRSVLEFRIARMRAWRDRTDWMPRSDPGVREPYVQASLALEAVRRGDAPVRRFRADEPGVLMLLPLLRTRDLLEPT